MSYFNPSEQTPAAKAERALQWEAKEKQRIADKAERADSTLVIAQTVGVLLGGEVLPLKEDSCYGYEGRYVVHFDDGKEVYLRFDQYGHKGKIEVGGYYPDGVRKRSSNINVSEDKTPERICLDIQRRFMPEYTVCWDEAVLEKARNDKYKSDKAARVAELKTIKGVSGSACSEHLYINSNDMNGSISYISTQGMCTLELRNVSIDLIKRILEVTT